MVLEFYPSAHLSLNYTTSRSLFHLSFVSVKQPFHECVLIGVLPLEGSFFYLFNEYGERSFKFFCGDIVIQNYIALSVTSSFVLA